MKFYLLMVGIFCLPLCAMTHFSNEEIVLMQNIYHGNNSDLSKKEVVRRLIEDQYLLAQAKILQPKLLKRQSKVGFDTNYHKRRYLLTLFKPFLNSKFVVKQVDSISKKKLQEILGTYPINGRLSKNQKIKLKSIKLISNKLINLTLFEIYQSLSMQNRFKLHQGDESILLQEVNFRYAFRQISEYIKPILTHKNISFRALENIALAEILRSPMQNYFGINQTMHSESIMLVHYEKMITEQQISDFYKDNIKNFKYLSHVKSKAVYFDTHDKAQKFYISVNNAGWNKTVKNAALNDIFRKYHNRLSRKLNSNNWAIQTAFNYPENKISPPIRSPKGHWLVLSNGNKIYELYELNTTTVKYQAKKHIAKLLAKKNYYSGFNKWLKSQN